MYAQMSDGTQLYYQIDGRLDAPTIVFVGGFYISSAWWQQQLPLAQNFRLVRFDARGVGASDKPANTSVYSMAQNVENLHTLLVSLDLQEVTLVGWSMGVSVALAYCLRYEQERVARLVLVDGSPRMLQALDWQWGGQPGQGFLFLLTQMNRCRSFGHGALISLLFSFNSIRGKIGSIPK